MKRWLLSVARASPIALALFLYRRPYYARAKMRRRAIMRPIHTVRRRGKALLRDKGNNAAR